MIKLDNKPTDGYCVTLVDHGFGKKGTVLKVLNIVPNRHGLIKVLVNGRPGELWPADLMYCYGLFYNK